MDVENRYSCLESEDRVEEILLLKGKGCFWKRCRFCDYYLDSDPDESFLEDNLKILEKVKGNSWLTVLNSGSWFELSRSLREKIIQICLAKNIKDLTIESHWHYRKEVAKLREELRKLGITLHSRIGIETFDEHFRERILNKGFGNVEVEKIKEFFDQCCLLIGVEGQTIGQLENDLKLASENFEDIYLNIYEPRHSLKDDKALVKNFLESLYPKYEKNPSMHLLINNTDLGVG